MNGKITQIAIPVLDFNKAKQFYEALFGWNVDIETFPNYALVKWESDLSLGFFKADVMPQPGINMIFEVDNIEDCTETIQQHEGEIIQDIHKMGDKLGVLFKDCFGNRFRLISKETTE
ncbi:MAG: VOC family protein [Candidatus Kariarchaeaceae archaeon]|jgi:predicted enzyme related to lactoylglutathione lyase